MNTIAQILFWTFILLLWIGMVLKVGFIKASLLTLWLVILIPKSLCIGLITISLHFTLSWFIHFWPITLIICLLAWMGRHSESQEHSSCKRLS